MEGEGGVEGGEGGGVRILELARFAVGNGREELVDLFHFHCEVTK